MGILDDTVALHPNGLPLVKHFCLCANKMLMFYNIKEKDYVKLMSSFICCKADLKDHTLQYPSDGVATDVTRQLVSEKGKDHHQHIQFFITLFKSPTGINKLREVGEGGLVFCLWFLFLNYTVQYFLHCFWFRLFLNRMQIKQHSSLNHSSALQYRVSEMVLNQTKKSARIQCSKCISVFPWHNYFGLF